MPEMIQINFARPFPVFPLAGVCLLPHASVPLRIFEPRYVQMVADALDSSGQMAMATFDGDQWKHEYHGNPPIRPIVCVCVIERHEKLSSNLYHVILQGVCRARIIQEEMPSETRAYRVVNLAPLETNPDSHEPELAGWRQRVRDLLADDSMAHLRFQTNVLEWFDKEEIPTHVLIEIVGHLLMTTTDDAERRYRLLSEPDPVERAEFTEDQLRRLKRVIDSACPQKTAWPKGMSWN